MEFTVQLECYDHSGKQKAHWVSVDNMYLGLLVLDLFGQSPSFNWCV
jgi:hypothetical protein